MDLFRNDILTGKYFYPKDIIKLRPTKHFNKRLESRSFGIPCIPEHVRITKENVYSGKTKDGRAINSIVIRLVYNSKKFLYLCFNPLNGVAKSMWYGNRSRRKNSK